MGKAVLKKINKHMLKGNSYITARHKMGNSRYNKANVAKNVGKALRIAGSMAGLGFSIGKLMDMYSPRLNRIYRTASKKQLNKYAGIKLAAVAGSALSAIGGAVIERQAKKEVRKYSDFY